MGFSSNYVGSGCPMAIWRRSPEREEDRQREEVRRQREEEERRRQEQSRVQREVEESRRQCRKTRPIRFNPHVKWVGKRSLIGVVHATITERRRRLYGKITKAGNFGKSISLFGDPRDAAKLRRHKHYGRYDYRIYDKHFNEIFSTTTRATDRTINLLHLHDQHYNNKYYLITDIEKCKKIGKIEDI